MVLRLDHYPNINNMNMSVKLPTPLQKYAALSVPQFIFKNKVKESVNYAYGNQTHPNSLSLPLQCKSELFYFIE